MTTDMKSHAGASTEPVCRNPPGSDGCRGWKPSPPLAPPAEGEEIMVNTPYDVFILPLRPSGLDGNGPRFVVHVPGPEQPAAVDGAEPIYYMRDNHTFKRLSDHVPTALIEIEAEFNAGYAHGMLCSKRPGFKNVHASGDKSRVAFLAACEESLTAARAALSKENSND